MISDRNKVDGCILGGALGDAFGAPIEGFRSLEEIQKKFGPMGQMEFTPYKSFWDDSEPEGMGIITDDTTMMACTFAGLIESRKAVGPDNWRHRALDTTWQYYLTWGSKQQYGEALTQFIRPDTKIPDYLEPFLFRCGAGKNTIAALLTGKRGDTHDPVDYNCELAGKKLVGPNAGCGGMMRVAPIAFFYDEIDIPHYARRNAAITHGHPDAMNATAIVTMMIANSLKTKTLRDAITLTTEEIKKLPDNFGIKESFRIADTAFKDNVADIQIIERLGYAQVNNPFLALPVLTQTLYAVNVASIITDPTAEDFKNTLRLAVNHSGDSDSVGALVGNIVGASWGADKLPQDWLKILPMLEPIQNLSKQMYPNP